MLSKNIKAIRKSKGLSALKPTTHSALVKAGQTRAPEMAYLFEHERPNGTIFSTTFMTNTSGHIKTEPNGLTPYYWGENIVYGDADSFSVKDLFDAWVNSPGHYENMVTKEFKQIVPFGFWKRIPVYGYDYDENGYLKYMVVDYTYERYFGTIFYTDYKTN